MMRPIIHSLLALGLLTVAAWAQQPNTVTANVSIRQTAAGGTATFQMQFVDTSLSSTVGSAVNVLGGAGASEANLVGVSVSLNQGFVVTQYNFTVRVASGDFSSTRDKLIAAQRALATSNTQAMAWSVDYAVPQDDQARILREALPALLERAKTQAEALAVAMGKTLGSVSSLSTPAVTASGLELTLSLAATYTVQ